MRAREELGTTTDDVARSREGTPPCSSCGVWRRQLLNRAARAAGADALDPGLQSRRPRPNGADEPRSGRPRPPRPHGAAPGVVRRTWSPASHPSPRCRSARCSSMPFSRSYRSTMPNARTREGRCAIASARSSGSSSRRSPERGSPSSVPATGSSISLRRTRPQAPPGPVEVAVSRPRPSYAGRASTFGWPARTRPPWRPRERPGGRRRGERPARLRPETRVRRGRRDHGQRDRGPMRARRLSRDPRGRHGGDRPAGSRERDPGARARCGAPEDRAGGPGRRGRADGHRDRPSEGGLGGHRDRGGARGPGDQATSVRRSRGSHPADRAPRFEHARPFRSRRSARN